MAYTIYYSRNTILNVKTKLANGDPAPQSSPYPRLLIEHSTLYSSISQKTTDYNISLYPYEVSPNSGEYQVTLSSSLFNSSITSYHFKIDAEITDRYTFDIFDANVSLENGPVSDSVLISRDIKQNQTFYRDNYNYFFPEAEVELIEGKQKYKLTIETVMNQLDQLDELANGLLTLTRIDEIPDEYMRYLAQVVGYESSDFTIANIALRNIVREIFHIYNLRGTAKGFQQFFKTIGYTSNFKEQWYSGALEITDHKPYATEVASSPGNWRYNELTGSELLRSSVWHGALDLIRQNDGTFRFVELYPTSVMNYSFSAKYNYREAGKFNKSERAINEITANITTMELVPDILNQMLSYIAFLKPVHIKLILSFLKTIDDVWWKVSENDNGPATETSGNIPRNIDEVDIEYVVDDKLIGSDVITGSAIFDHKDRYYFYNQLYFNGTFNFAETNNASWKFDNITKEFLAAEDVGMVVKYIDPYSFATTITILN